MNQANSTQVLESMSQAVWYNCWTLNKFKKYLSGDILEVGCGIGNFTKTLVDYGQVRAIDINQEYIKKLKQEIGGKAQVGFGDIEKGSYFFKNQQFDSIVCLNVLEHIEDDDVALKNLHKLLKKEGKLILLVPAHLILYGEIDKSISHLRRYERKELIEKLEGVGFKIISSRIINFLGALGWFIAGKIFRTKMVGEGSIKMFNLIAPLVLPFEDLIKPPIGTSILIVAEK